MAIRHQSRKKTWVKNTSNTTVVDENDVERLLPNKPQLSSQRLETSQNIFLDDMIRHSKDNLFRIYHKPTKTTQDSGFHQNGGICSHFSLMCKIRPRLFAIFAFVLFSIFLTSFSQVIQSQTSKFKLVSEDYGSLIDTDYSDVKSIYDLSLRHIDHWCSDDLDESCDCEDPLEPASRGFLKQWVRAHEENLDTIEGTLSHRDVIDVAFLGGSIVEGWAGRSTGRNKFKLENAKDSYQRHFNATEGGNFTALALGIHRDTSPNVLWRLLHGELNEKFKPKVWWLVLGTTDLAEHECSEEIALLGVLRVIEEITTQQPDAIVVVNSILPIMVDGSGHETGIKYDMHDRHSYDATSAEANFNEDVELPAVTETEEIQQNDQSRRMFVWPFQRKEEEERKFLSSVAAVNSQLKKFCEKNKNVEFFDADKIFIDYFEDGNFLKSELMNRHGVPTESGSTLWHQEITKSLQELLH